MEATQFPAIPVVYWELSSKIEVTTLRRFLTVTFFQASQMLGFDMSCKELSSEMLSGKILPETLMRTPQFELTANPNALGENTLDSTTLQGAGSLLPLHGFLPLIMLLHLQEAYKNQFHNISEPLVSFCDSECNPFAWTDFNGIDHFITLFNADKDIVRQSAASVGLCMDAIKLDRIECNVEDLFF